MCTIITVSREFFTANQEAVVERMRKDAVYNPHGFAILLLGKTEEEHVMLKSMDVETAILLTVGNDNWQRMFFHARFSTTDYVKLSDCHGYMTSGDGVKSASVFGKDDWWIAHNGILSHDMADAYRVDSQYIPARLRSTGLNDTVYWLINEETYANVMMASIVSGKVVVTRAQSGTLMMDLEGKNFSSNAIGSINIPVPHKTYYTWTETIKAKSYVSRTYSSYSGSNWNKSSNKYTKEAKDYWSNKYGPADENYSNTGWDYAPYTDADLISEDPSLTSVLSKARGHNYLDYSATYCGKEGIELLRDDLKDNGFDNFEDFFDLAYEMGWLDGEKVPNRIYDVLSSEQKGWIRGCRNGVAKERENLDNDRPTKTGT